MGAGRLRNGVSFPQYKANMESWFQDQDFWADMTSYVSDFFQEAYGDVRNYAIAGLDPPSRVDLLNVDTALAQWRDLARPRWPALG